MIKAILFDFDGTIADTLPLVVSSIQKAAFPFYQRVLSYDEIAQTFGPCEEGSLQILLPNHYKEATNLFYKYYEEDAKSLNCEQPFLGIIELLQNLKKHNIIIGLVTGKGTTTTNISLKKYNMLNTFDIIKTGSTEKSIKTECIIDIIKKYKLNAEDVVYIGDMPSDIDSAKQANCKIISVLYADKKNEQQILAKKPDKICYSLDELSSFLLQQLNNEVFL